MKADLHYGVGSTLRLDIPQDRLLADCRTSGKPLSDPRGATVLALRNPLGYPPLSQAIVPGDRVALVLDGEVPEPEAIVLGVIESLLAGDVARKNITLLLSEASSQQHSFSLPEEIELITHDPKDQDSLALLGTSQQGEAIYLNRALADADLVIPIACVRQEDVEEDFGIFGSLYKGFCGESCLKQLQEAVDSDATKQVTSARQTADEVGWLLGIRLLVHVVPALANKVLNVVAGDLDQVVPEGRSLLKKAWTHQVPARGSLVIVAIQGPASWDQLGKAVAMADEIVTETDGAIVLCTELSDLPGPAMRMLAETDDFESAQELIGQFSASDTRAATRMAKSLGRGTVYLLSQLEEAIVEELGIAPISKEDDVARLTKQFDSCILLAGGQYAQVTVAGK